MKSESMYQEDLVAVFQADRHGHPQRVYVNKLQLITSGQRLVASRADKYGHVTTKAEEKNLPETAGLVPTAQ
jgi:hypothetical protein